ncbi:class I SAM-dependent RNA methyltransferase [Arthrobacter sp. TMT4-20]|uniref:class I SAM-dependent RNA methyltransferase n=1 Tax=Arthrobacter sp. TB 23 TaxID=494419 RepID=UPI00036C0D68|nr:TRAM domain-containing protein [Arthrobacter sp. TB 23]
MTDDPAGTLELTIGPVAHGGHCVARHEGRVIFVRHALPGETVRARLTEHDDGASFWRADVVEVVQASPDRVNHPWPLADALLSAQRGASPVGGAEFGHIALAAQRKLKATVFSEQLHRLAGVDREIEVEPVPGESPDGLRWRTRASFAVAPDGHLAMHAHRSNELIPVAEMPLAIDAINELQLWTVNFSGIQRVEVAVGSAGDPPLVLLVPAPGARRKQTAAVVHQIDGPSVALWDPEKGTVERVKGKTWLAETVGSQTYRITGDGFWQIHRGAPGLLMDAVLGGLAIQPGERAADLYSGAGLFTAPIADAVGETGSVLAVEGSPGASRDAKRNLHGRGQVDIVQGKVDRVLRDRKPSLDVVVLDPPRAGAGQAAITEVIAAGPRAVGYVSCDPASFARDVGYFQQAGWELDTLRVFDLYPHTHHMESFAVLRPSQG